MAMNDIVAGKAYVELLLRDKNFFGKLKRARQTMFRFARVTTAVATATAVAGVRAYLKLCDQLDKMSQRTGLSVEALSELRHATDQSGASIDDLERAVKAMQDRWADSVRGVRSAQDAFTDLGLDLAKLEELDTEGKLEAIAEALSKIDDPDLRSGLAQNLFGSRAGAQILPMIENMAALRQEARDAGITMSTESAQGAAQLLDMLTLLGKQARVVMVEVGAAVAPLMRMVLPAMHEWGRQTIDLVRSVGGYLKENTRSTVNFFAEAYIQVFSRISFLVTNFSNIFETAMVRAQLAMVQLSNRVESLFGTNGKPMIDPIEKELAGRLKGLTAELKQDYQQFKKDFRDALGDFKLGDGELAAPKLRIPWLPRIGTSARQEVFATFSAVAATLQAPHVDRTQREMLKEAQEHRKVAERINGNVAALARLGQLRE